MKKIYRLDSDFTQEEIDEISSSLPTEGRELLECFAGIEMAETYLKEDGTYHPSEGKDVMIVILAEWEKEKMSELMDMVFDPSKYEMSDISEDVLFGRHSEKTYVGTEDEMKSIFDSYLDDYLDQDTVLDKINMYGISSLTERDKKVLES
jgi:hypothetical protein